MLITIIITLNHALSEAGTDDLPHLPYSAAPFDPEGVPVMQLSFFQ